MRLAQLAPLPAPMLQFTTKQKKNCAHQKKCFVTPYTFFLVPPTPTRCSVSYRFRGSPSLIMPHPLQISNYASAPPYWKKYRKLSLPEQNTVYWMEGLCGSHNSGACFRMIIKPLPRREDGRQREKRTPCKHVRPASCIHLPRPSHIHTHNPPPPPPPHTHTTLPHKLHTSHACSHTIP